MAEKFIQPWITVNGHMTDTYREIVVQNALNQWQSASDELRRYADSHLSYVTIPGFRSIKKAPVLIAVPHVAKTMQKRKAVANSIICLWAESQNEIIDDLIKRAQEIGIKIETDWDWEKALFGYFDFEDIKKLSEFVDEITKDFEEPLSDHYKLAALWLSGGIVQENIAEEIESASKDENHQSDQATEQMDDEIISQEKKSDNHEEPDKKDMPPTEPVEIAKVPSEVPLKNLKNETSQETADSETVIVVIDSDEIKSIPIDKFLNQWSELSGNLDQVRLQTSEALQILLESIRHDQVDQIDLLMSQSKEKSNLYKYKFTHFKSYSSAALERLDLELTLRPDLDKSSFTFENMKEYSELQNSALIKNVKEIIEQINMYDGEKSEIIEKVDVLQAEITKIKLGLKSWETKEDENFILQKAYEDFESVTLSELLEYSQKLEVTYQSLSTKYIQLREQSIGRIRTKIENIKDKNEDEFNKIVKNGFIPDLNNLELQSLTDDELRSLEDELQKLINHLISQSQNESIKKLASDLNENWDEASLIKLQKQLASEKREVEAFLLELSANNVHPRTNISIYSTEIIKNLVNGISQISSKAKLYEFLGWIAPTFFSGFIGENENSQSEICLITLAAFLSSEYIQPTGFMWQISSEWPINEMKSWNKLWQSILLNEEIQIFTDQKESSFHAELIHFYNEVENIFKRDGAHFNRLNSLQSNRHRTLLSNKLFPHYLELYLRLKKRSQILKNSEADTIQDKLEQLISFYEGTVKPELLEENILKKYESGLYEEGIDDNETFHRKISLRILKECAESIQKFGESLIGYWELKNSRINGLNCDDLENEQKYQSILTAFGQSAYEHIVKYQPINRHPWDETIINRLILDHLIHEILTQPSTIMRLPRLVGKLVNSYLDWDDILKELLIDISDPMLADQAAVFLLKVKAPNQALMLVQDLTLENQKISQEMRSDFERQMVSLWQELMQLGGNIENISFWHDIGRWGYLVQNIKKEIKSLRDKQESKSKIIAEESLSYRQKINNLDLELFEIKNELPSGVYEIVCRGIATVRQASEKEELFSMVEDFVRELIYVKEHNSWQRDELLKSVIQLENSIIQIEETPRLQITPEQLLQYFEEGDLSTLQLTNNQISPSEINTRIDLLQNWLQVKKLKGLLFKDIHQVGATIIQNLFRYFAQMIVMKKFRNIDNKEMVFETPLVYEYWQLQYPRTAALDNQCIMIALPGNPPSIIDIKNLLEFIEDKGFLEDYFVLLFVPGADERVYKRFQGMGDSRGLVIIDENTLIRILLAEVDSNNPVGRLRPLMLNSIKANTNIFSVNQTVDSRTAIFVGRDNLINNIINSGVNYPIYGGRRIGKSSLLKAVEQRLIRKNVQVVSYTLEGDRDLSDLAVCNQLAEKIGLYKVLRDGVEFKSALLDYLDMFPEKTIVIILDEVDRYIQVNDKRHTMIEAFRAASDRFGNRFRVLIAGFMELFDCLSGRGPYSQTSDPWRRMLDNEGPLGNLTSINAEGIVKEGFLSILGWEFENRAIPQYIVERTGGHPAFVQEFCLKILERVRQRGDCLVRVNDVDAVFDDNDPKHSFIAYVRETLEMNLDALGRYLVVMLASKPEKSLGFTWDEICDLANSTKPPIPEEKLRRSLEYLIVTSVVHEVSKNVYEYTVPDYPKILERLGDTAHLDELEDALRKEVGEK